MVKKREKDFSGCRPFIVHGVLHWTGTCPSGYGQTHHSFVLSSLHMESSKVFLTPSNKDKLPQYLLLTPDSQPLSLSPISAPLLSEPPGASSHGFSGSIHERFLQPGAALWYNPLVCKLRATLTRPEHKPLGLHSFWHRYCVEIISEKTELTYNKMFLKYAWFYLPAIF